MNPYLDRKRKDEDLARVEAAGPVARSDENPYGSPFASKAKVQGPELGQELAQAQALEPEEVPMQAEEGAPAWARALNYLPAAGMALMHLGGKGSAESRATGNQYLQQATEQNEQDQRRVANSKVKARAYNNRILQRKQERKRQKEQDAIAAEGRAITAEDRQRRIGKEDLQASREAEDYAPDSAKNVALKQGIAQTYPEEWKKLSPEQQQSITVKNYEEVLGLPISEAKRKQKVEDDIRTEREKQRAELEFDTTKPTIFGGNTYIGGQYRGGGGGQPPDPTKPPDPDADNKFMQDMIAIYGEGKVPIVKQTAARAAWEAANSGTMKNEDATTLRQKLITDANTDLLATRAEEHKQTAEGAAAKKVERQQDNQFAVQRRLHKIDDLEGNLNTVIQELSKEIGPVDPETGLFPSEVKGNISGAGATAWAGPFKGRQGRRNSKAVKELLDTKIRKATGAAANIGEERRFEEIMGWGPLMRDVDLVDGVNQAIKFLQSQKDVLDTYYPEAADRFHERQAEKKKAKETPKEEAKPPDKPTIRGDKILLPNGKVGPNTPENRKLLGL